MGIMSGLAALGRVAGGVTQGLRMAEDDAVRREEQDYQRGQRRRMLDQQARDDQLRTDLPAALAPVPVQELSGPPAQDGTGPGYKAGDENFPTAAAANSPAAVGQRVMAAYTRAGRPTEGLRMRTDMQTAATAEAAAKDAERRRTNEELMGRFIEELQKGPEAAAKFATEAYHNGLTYRYKPLEGHWGSFEVVDGTGNVKDIQQFKNPEDAVARVWMKLDPLKAVDWITKRNDKADETAYKGRELDLKGREQTDKGRLIDAQIAALNRRDSGGSGLGRMQASDDDKLPPAVKLKYQGYQRELDRLTTAVTNAQAQGGWDPHAPGNASQQALAMRMANLQTEMDALLTPYQPRAASPAGAAAQPGDPMDVRKTLAAKAAAAQTGQGRAGQAATPGDAPPAAPPDETARRVQTTPVIDFTAASGQRRRMTAAQGELPGLEQAVINAQRAVQAAAAQGPMAVARARDELSRARTELQMARDRAGQ